MRHRTPRTRSASTTSPIYPHQIGTRRSICPQRIRTRQLAGTRTWSRMRPWPSSWIQYRRTWTPHHVNHGGKTPGYMGPPTIGGEYFATPPQTQHVQAPLYSNLTKKFVNWNACYSCGFDVPDGHTSQTFPHHLRKPDHDIHFTRQNAQQYIDQGYNCATKYRHKTVFPQM